MSINEQQELNRLIELKKQLENKQRLQNDESQELFSLLIKYRQYANLSTDEINQEILNQQVMTASNREPVSIQSNNGFDVMIETYKRKYNQEAWYKEPEIKKDPQTGEEKAELSFGSQGNNSFLETVAEYHQELAEQKEEFVMWNKDGKVMAYSNGDGKLYHHDGKEFQIGDMLTASNIDHKDFKQPENAPSVRL